MSALDPPYDGPFFSFGLKEVPLRCAIYCGVPAANSAFAIAQRVLEG
jgi:hypothetical protein